MAESLVHTLKRDYLPFTDLCSAIVAMRALPELIERCSQEHPHSALGYRSPREYQASQINSIAQQTTFVSDPVCATTESGAFIFL